MLTGPPGAGKTVAMTALSDALVADKLEYTPAHHRSGPPGWPGLDHLLGETEPLHTSMPQLDGVRLALDTEQLGPTEIAERVRAARPDMLAASPR